MANVDNPHGLAFLGRSLSGGPSAFLSFYKDAGAAAIYQNDCIQRDADGGVSPGVSTPVVGVALHASATGAEGYIVTSVDPGAVYEAQDNADSDGFALLDMGANCSVEANAGSATTGISGHELDEDTANTTATLLCHLIRLFPDPNNAYGAHARVEVNLNAAALGSQTAGIAG